MFLIGRLQTSSCVVRTIAKAVDHSLFTLDKHFWQIQSNTEEDKNGPLPSEGVECDTEGEPPEQLEVSKEVKRTSWAVLLEELCHVNPALHPERARAREGVNQEHEEDASVNSNMPVANGANGGDVSAVDSRQ